MSGGVLVAEITRRDFIKYSGVAGGSLLLGKNGGVAMAENKNRVAFLETKNRVEGAKNSMKALGINPVKNKDVLIKPNFNTADPVPGSTDNDTLKAIIEEVWEMGAKTVTLGERSFPPTMEVMEQKELLPLLEKLEVKVIDFDDLDDSDWVKLNPKDSHWEDGLRIARPILEAECLISTCCLKTHQFGGVFSMSLKLNVGVVPTTRHGYEYMRELHTSPNMRKMIAEINAQFRPDLIVLDGIDVFVDGGPMSGKRAEGNVFLASTDRVAVDAVGVAVLKSLGSNDQIMNRKIFEQEQIQRAAELGLGASSPSEIDLAAVDQQSQKYRDRIMEILNKG